MPREDQNEFNRCAGNIFAREYERETGVQLKFKGLSKDLRLQDFPDMILERIVDEQEIDVELVGVVLGFINKEQTYFERSYRKQFYDLLETYRPKFKNVGITLQPSMRRIEALRPFNLPAMASLEGKRLIADFKAFLSKHCSDLSSIPQSILLENLAFPELTKYFEAVLLNPISDDDPRKPHSDSPIIMVSTIYQRVESERVIQEALKKKLDKGYKADILLLHTLRLSPFRAEGVLDLSMPSAYGDRIVEIARLLIPEQKALLTRFKEFWFLDAYMTEGKRLYRLTG